MVQTIGNPLSWGAKSLGGAGRRAGEVATHLGSTDVSAPKINSIDLGDIRTALWLGWRDLLRFRSDVLALVLIYPLIGFALVFLAFEQALLPMLFPMAAGFALLGPVASVGMYEISRQHEDGENASWGSALSALRSRVVGPVMMLGAFMLFWFMLWMAAAFAVYSVTLGPAMPTDTLTFLSEVFATSAGWSMIVLGMGVGAVFAIVVLFVSAIGFPMLIDKPVGLPMAVATSIKAVSQNLKPMLAWGMIVSALLALATIPVFLGLILVLPWLGHATWHLYRMTISRDS